MEDYLICQFCKCRAKAMAIQKWRPMCLEYWRVVAVLILIRAIPWDRLME